MQDIQDIYFWLLLDALLEFAWCFASCAFKSSEILFTIRLWSLINFLCTSKSSCSFFTTNNRKQGFANKKLLPILNCLYLLGNVIFGLSIVHKIKWTPLAELWWWINWYDYSWLDALQLMRVKRGMLITKEKYVKYFKSNSVIRYDYLIRMHENKYNLHMFMYGAY